MDDLENKTPSLPDDPDLTEEEETPEAEKAEGELPTSAGDEETPEPADPDAAPEKSDFPEKKRVGREKMIKIALTVTAIVCAAAAAVLAFMLIVSSVIAAPVTAEIGEQADLSRFETGFARLVCKPSSENDLSTDTLDEREITVRFFGFIEKKVPFYVTDTTPPTVVPRNLRTVRGTVLSPDDFIASADDRTEVGLSFKDSGDTMSADGDDEVTVTVSVTDACGNRTDAKATLFIDEKMKMEIEFGTDEDGMRAAFSRAFPDLERVDLSSVNLNECGTTVIRASDVSGTLCVLSVPVRDTTAPTAEARSYDVLVGDELSVDSLVGDVYDLSPTEIRFGAEPDLSTPGKQEIPITVSDSFGNETEIISEIIVHSVPENTTVERGTPNRDAASLILNGDTALSLPEDFSFSSLPLGKTEVELSGKYNSFTVSVTVADTTAPLFSLKRVTVFENQPVYPADFILYCSDFSPVTYRFDGEVKTDKAGDVDVTVIARDEASNETAEKTVLHVVKDTAPPVIYGVYYRMITVGADLPQFSDVYAYDNADGVLSVDIDLSEVDPDKAGTYTVKYSVSDRAGNKSESRSTLYVSADKTQMLYSIADEILSQITNQGMSAREKAWAIYTWVNGNIRYSTSTSYLMGNYVEGALSGFRIRSGNCFIYYAVSDVLLERAGITSIEVKRNIPDRPHYWNLVYINGAWYHFDACPHYASYPLTSFLLTDAQVREYSQRCVDYYSFDEYLYPRTP